MTTEKQLKLAYDRFNLRAEGPSKLTAGNWAFNDTVLMYQDAGYQRWIPDAHGGRVRLMRDYDTRAHHGHNHSPSAWDARALYKNEAFAPISRIKRARTWLVPHIGVHSRFPGDMLSLHETHELNRSFFLLEIANYYDEAISTLSAAEVKPSILMAIVSNMYRRYANYSELFGLSWKPMPPVYGQQIDDKIKAKIDRYHSPAQVTKRERAAARKTAKEAFGIAGKR